MIDDPFIGQCRERRPRSMLKNMTLHQGLHCLPQMKGLTKPAADNFVVCIRGLNLPDGRINYADMDYWAG